MADWVLMVMHLLPGGFFATLLPSLLRHFPNNLAQVLITAAISLATLGYLGASLTLLLRFRRAAAVLEALCTLAWWCGGVYFWLIGTPTVRLHPATLAWIGGMFLIGTVHLLIAGWLWRQKDQDGKD